MSEYFNKNILIEKKGYSLFQVTFTYLDFGFDLKRSFKESFTHWYHTRIYNDKNSKKPKLKVTESLNPFRLLERFEGKEFHFNWYQIHYPTSSMTINRGDVLKGCEKKVIVKTGNLKKGP